MIALDRSRGLLDIARGQVWQGTSGDKSEKVGGDVKGGGAECIRGDLGARCWRNGVFVSQSCQFHPSGYRCLRRRRFPVGCGFQHGFDRQVSLADTQDFVISVAAIHHLSTPLRRRQAVQVSVCVADSSIHIPTPPPCAHPTIHDPPLL